MSLGKSERKLVSDLKKALAKFDSASRQSYLKIEAKVTIDFGDSTKPDDLSVGRLTKRDETGAVKSRTTWEPA